VRGLVEEAHERAVALLNEQRRALDAIASALREREVVGEEELQAILSEHGIPVSWDDADVPDQGAEESASAPEQPVAAKPNDAPPASDVPDQLGPT
jgi:cell division protease FtsH